MFSNHFRANVVSKFNPIQMREVRRLQRRLLDTPEDFLYHIRQCVVPFLDADGFTHWYYCTSAVSSINLAVTYGMQTNESKDPYTEMAEKAISSLRHVGPGTFLVDVLPARMCVCDPEVMVS